MKDLTGKRFGRLVVKSRAGSDSNKNATWLCECDCGSVVVKTGLNLRCGDTKSCGCLQKEIARNLMSTHKESKSRLYRVWYGIKNRCTNPKAVNYKYYGGRGINVCSEWLSSYEAFRDWAYENGYDKNADVNACTLDRIDVNKGYSPDNCRWANHTEQCRNQRSNRVYSYNGESHCLSEWAQIKGIKYSTLKARINTYGWDFERAINT